MGVMRGLEEREEKLEEEGLIIIEISRKGKRGKWGRYI